MLKALGNRGFRPCLPLRKRTQRPPNFDGEVGRGGTFGLGLCGQRRGPEMENDFASAWNWVCTETPHVSAQPQIAQNAKAISTEVSTEATEENLRRSRNASSKVFSFGQSLSIPKMLKALGNRGFRPCLPLRKRTQRPPNFDGEVGRGGTFGLGLCGQRRGPEMENDFASAWNWVCTETPQGFGIPLVFCMCFPFVYALAACAVARDICRSSSAGRAVSIQCWHR